MSSIVHFPYTQVPGQLPSWRPLLPIELRKGQHSLMEMALIDSGADANMLPFTLGQRLGLDWNSALTLPPASGRLSQIPTKAAFVEGLIVGLPPTVLGFMWVQRDDVPLILGQTNFFLEFDICVFRSQSVFQIQPRTP
jgi:hypothetical protein